MATVAMVEVPEGTTDWQRQEIERLRAALEAAASSMEWIASNGVDDEDPSSLKAYSRNRAMVARDALASRKARP